MAVSIFDRFLLFQKHWLLAEEDLRMISITSFLIAAKMCQDKSPLIDNLIYVLD